MRTKLLLITAAAGLALVGCQAPQSGGVSAKEFKALQQDVDDLKIAVYGDPRAICPSEKILDLAAYGENEAPKAQEDLKAWHAENGKRAGVKTTDSGLQYRVVQSGPKDGPSPEAGQFVKVHYHGFFPDGEVFDSSYERNESIEFPSNGVISGWVEALGEMKPCDAWTLYVPGNLAYGDSGRGAIPANATLIFNVQLLEVN